MPIQFFRGKGNVEFEEVKDSAQGSPFEQLLLGRSLAVLGWNRDGRQDFLISPVGKPVLLVTNQTEDSGHFIRIRLHAKTSSRDAQGTAVLLETSESQFWQQLTAGDGYQTSSVRTLHFGLNQSTSVKAVSVIWPSGTKETVQIPDTVDQTFDVVEGEGIFLCE